MKTYHLLNTVKAELYIHYLLNNGFAFEVKCYTGHVNVTVTEKADAPLTEWQATVMCSCNGTTFHSSDCSAVR